jgi:hypothetical protein
MKKPLSTNATITVVVLALVTGAICGFSSRGFTTSGFSTFFIAALIAWIVYGLIARAMSK